MAIIPVVAGVIIESRRILVAQRLEPPALAQKWEFPGGKVEPFERPEDALVREIAEELSLVIEPVERLGEFPYEYPRGKIHLIAIIARATTQKVTLHEHGDAQWLTLSEIRQLDMSPADWPVVEALKKRHDLIVT